LSWRRFLFGVLLVVYVAIIVGVIHRSPLLRLDTDVLKWDLRKHNPEWFPFIHTYVMLGQRAPSTMVALPWFLWRAWRTRNPHGLIMLGTALLTLNLSVGIVKLSTGRLGPHATHDAFAPFSGGDIFPSGHVANAVILYGVIAMLAVRYRRVAAALAVVVSFTVGLCTLYLDTHWLTDVLGGWLAGGLVLLALPWLTRHVERAVLAVWHRAAARWRTRAEARRAPRPAPRAAGRRPGYATPGSRSDRVGGRAATTALCEAREEPTRVG
jgi:undecaprenyl-diphosphatase